MTNLLSASSVACPTPTCAPVTLPRPAAAVTPSIFTRGLGTRRSGASEITWCPGLIHSRRRRKSCLPRQGGQRLVEQRVS